MEGMSYQGSNSWVDMNWLSWIFLAESYLPIWRGHCQDDFETDYQIFQLQQWISWSSQVMTKLLHDIKPLQSPEQYFLHISWLRIVKPDHLNQ